MNRRLLYASIPVAAGVFFFIISGGSLLFGGAFFALAILGVVALKCIGRYLDQPDIDAAQDARIATLEARLTSWAGYTDARIEEVEARATAIEHRVGMNRFNMPAQQRKEAG